MAPSSSLPPTPIIGSFGRLLFASGSKPRVPHAHADPQLIVHLGGKPIALAIAGEVVSLASGDAVLIQPWTVHSFVEPTSSASRWVSLLLRADWLEQSGLASRTTTTTTNSAPSRRLHPRLLDHFCAMPAQARRYRPAFGDLPGAIADALDTTSDCRPEGKAPWIDRRVRRALAHIDSRVDEANVDGLQAAAGVSRAQLFRLFKSNLGCTPHQVVAARRLSLAISELGEMERPVQEVALDLGFSTPGHFTRFFAQHLPITPSLYRENAIVV